MSVRKFEDKPATPEPTALLGGITGPQGSGKTKSALRIATGIQAVTGGEIFGLDTENGRMLHYANEFTFRHVRMTAPFSPLDYLAGIEHCVSRGATVIIVDSQSHEHEGPGGVLEWHETELDRMAGDDYKKRDRMTLLAWQKPKAARRRLLNTIVQLNVNVIFCFRAKEKTKPLKRDGKTDIVEMGWMAIAGEEFIYELAFNCLLRPGAGGVPVWDTDKLGEKETIKLPSYLRHVFDKPRQLDEQVGRQLAEWAKGSSDQAPSQAPAARRSSTTAAPRPPAPASDPQDFDLTDACMNYAKEYIANAEDVKTLNDWWSSAEQEKQRHNAGLSDGQVRELRGLLTARIRELGQGAGKRGGEPTAQEMFGR